MKAEHLQWWGWSGYQSGKVQCLLKSALDNEGFTLHMPTVVGMVRISER